MFGGTDGAVDKTFGFRKFHLKVVGSTPTTNKTKKRNIDCKLILVPAHGYCLPLCFK